jgi:hypothetical protein
MDHPLKRTEKQSNMTAAQDKTKSSQGQGRRQSTNGKSGRSRSPSTRRGSTTRGGNKGGKGKHGTEKRGGGGKEDDDDNDDDKPFMRASEMAAIVRKEGTLIIELRQLLDEVDSSGDEWDEEYEEEEQAAVVVEPGKISPQQNDNPTPAEEQKVEVFNQRAGELANMFGGGSSVDDSTSPLPLNSVPFAPAAEQDPIKEESEEDQKDEEEDRWGFGYKSITRKTIPIPKTYIDLQMYFAAAFPKIETSLSVERLNGKMVDPREKGKFLKDEVIVFREYMPEFRVWEQGNRGMNKKGAKAKNWEKEVYQKELDKFGIKSWQF